MRNIKLIIEYDGKEYNGWQKQKNKLNIQGEIEKAIETIIGEEIELIASGRTDAGVHSLGQTANFKTESTIQIEKIPIAINSQLKKGLNTHTPCQLFQGGSMIQILLVAWILPST